MDAIAHGLPSVIAILNPTRIITFEGAESSLHQLTVGIAERLGLYSPPWMEFEEIQPRFSRDWSKDASEPSRFSDAIDDDAWSDSFWDEDDEDGPAASPVPQPRGPDPKPNDAAEVPPQH